MGKKITIAADEIPLIVEALDIAANLTKVSAEITNKEMAALYKAAAKALRKRAGISTRQGRQAPLARAKLEELLGPRVAHVLMVAYGGRRLPQITDAEVERYVRDQAIRSYVDETDDSYQNTAKKFVCSIDTVKRACKAK